MKYSIAAVKKEFTTSFHIILADHPVVCRIANPVIFGELLPEGTVLVFGGYDLVLCYPQKGESRGGAYRTEVVSRTFVDKVSLSPTAAVGSGPEQGMRLHAYFSRPFRVQVWACKPSKLRFRELLRSILSDLTWLEVRVDGEFAVEAAMAREDLPEGYLSLPQTEASGEEGRFPEPAEMKEAPEANRTEPAEPELPGVREKAAVKRDHEIIMDMDLLADLVLRIVRRREAESVSEGMPPQRGEPPSGETPAEAVLPETGRAAEESQPQETAGGGEDAVSGVASQGLSREALEELVRKILREGGVEKAEPGASPPTPQAETAPAPVVAASPPPLSEEPALDEWTLGKIPSRPGLWKTFSQEIAPSMNPTQGIPGGSVIYGRKYSQMKGFPGYPPDKPEYPYLRH